MNTIRKNLEGILFAVLLIVGIFAALLPHASGSISVDTSAAVNTYKVYELFASTTAETTIATTTTATSTNINQYSDSRGRIVTGVADLRGAKKVTFYFTRGGITHANTGTSTFNVQTTRDGVNWDNYNMLVPNAATSTIVTKFSSVQLPASGPPATTTAIYFMDSFGGFFGARCVAVLQVDGEQSCSAAVQY